MAEGNVKIKRLVIVIAIFSLIAPLAAGGDLQYHRPRAIGIDLSGRQWQRPLSLSMLCNGIDYSQLGHDNQPAFKLVLSQPPDDTIKDSPGPQNKGAIGSDSQARKAIYLVCAGRYGVRADAERHIETLRLFGFSSRISVSKKNSFRVVLGKSDKSSKAAKIKSSFEKKGVACFIEEE
jgi:hypothetical protein